MTGCTSWILGISSRPGTLVQKETAQLLIIVSDGRLMSEGSETVKGTIQRARESGIFIVYLLLDNPSTSQVRWMGRFADSFHYFVRLKKVELEGEPLEFLCCSRNDFNNVFVRFKGSVMEMQSASFDAATSKPVIRRYMASFPFPFYVVLRELDSMPVVLGEALRQWFELVTAK